MTTSDRTLTYGCPVWCEDPHDERDLAAGSLDHTLAVLHDLGGAYVGLHRLDRAGSPGPVRVVVDTPDVELDPSHAARVRDAVNRALRTA